MAHRFTYNPETCKYEPIIVTPKAFARKSFRFLTVTFILGVVGLIYYNTQYPLLDEVRLAKENQNLKYDWQLINSKLKATSEELAKLEDKDDHNYRVILGMEPLSASEREAGVGGQEKASADIENPIIRAGIDYAEKIKNRLTVEIHSMNALKKQLINNQKQWAARPAIQPISNKELIQLYLVYGMRYLPQDGYSRPHNGLDFVANFNSPIYSTGDGVVTYAKGGTTYGNAVFVNHSYGFETRYAHMNRIIVAEGQQVKRGQVLGYVGSTGHSFGPHLHYEVLYQGNFVNPIGFFQRDLTNIEYEKLISNAHGGAEALD
jgi:murein DD-endopeptidase MepM/ murein hydrolase activator NlpD